MNDSIPFYSPWPRKWVSRLALSTTLALSAPLMATSAQAEEESPDELEVTLEIFDDSASLEAFEIDLSDLHDDDKEAGHHEDDPDSDDRLSDRMDRFDEEVARAS